MEREQQSVNKKEGWRERAEGLSRLRVERNGGKLGKGTLSRCSALSLLSLLTIMAYAITGYLLASMQRVSYATN